MNETIAVSKKLKSKQLEAPFSLRSPVLLSMWR